jgi:signal peptidase I
MDMNQFRSEADPEPEPETKAEKGGGGWRLVREALETILLSLVIFGVINTLSARIRVESVSMQPTLYAGDFVIVNKLAYRLGEPKRGDVIVFRYPPAPEQEPYIKRIIGLPGDRVTISGGKVAINGEFLEEPYLNVTTNQGGEWIVPPDSLFVMGDNRNSSSDSRAWGMVPFENVIGKGLVVYWPPGKWGLLSFPSAAAAGP